MTGIFYFSSTGNSLFIAKMIKSELSANIYYIPQYHGNVKEFDRIIVVSPVYSWGLPAHVYDFLQKLDREIRLDIVLNYGGMLGGADRFSYEHAKNHGLNIHSVYTIKMPENYTLTFSVPSFYSKAILKSAPKRIAKIIENIRNGEKHIPEPQKTKAETYRVNKANWHLIARDFSVTEDCVRCAKCVQLCPTDNISLREGKIEFDDHCVACLGCYHRCPQKAIRYKNRRKKDRYLNPNIQEQEIGQNL